jgi:hypothetical protein
MKKLSGFFPTGSVLLTGAVVVVLTGVLVGATDYIKLRM